VRATRATATATKTAKHRRGVKITIIAVCAILVLTIAGIVALVWSLNERLNDLDIGDLLGGDRPASASASSTVRNPGDPFSGRAVNIVVMGTDSRQGAAGAYSGDGDEVEGMRADTTFIAHISADRTRVDALSIPRDTFITIPECVLPDGELVPEAGWTEQGFNAAFASGAFTGDVGAGAACAIRAIEEMTDVRMDGFVVVDFAGFAQIVDAIGGVDICLSEAIDSPDADNLVLPAGFNHLTGALATQYARARTGDGTGDGSDLGRIDRQQVLFTAIARKALSLNIVSDFPKLYDFIGSVMDAVTTDIGGIADLAGFAYSLRNLDMAEINFYTVPITDAWDGAHVELETEEAAPFFEALSTDVPMATAVTPDEDVHHNSDVNGFEPVEPTSSVMPTWEPPDPDATVSIDPRCQ
jgi:LCP family protein required for cell wall assembly